MVVPVVVIRDIEPFGRTLGKAQKVRLAVIPEMVVTERHVGRFFAIQGAIAFGLVLIATGKTVEKVAVVHPDVLVVLLETDVVAFVGTDVHDAEVPDFDILRALDADAPAIRRSIVADAFDCKRRAFFFAHIHDNIALVVCFGRGHIAKDTNSERTRVIAFFVDVQDVLKAGARFDTTLAILDYIELDRIFCRFRDVKDYRIFLERSVGVVRAGDVPITKRKTAAVMRLD